MADPDIKRLVDLMRSNVDPADAASAGVWYEPRSLWLVKNVNIFDYLVFGNEGPAGHTVTVQLPRNPFRNGTRFPITINRMAMSGVGYPFARPDVAAMQAASPGPADLNGTTMINTMRVTVASPYRTTFSMTPSLMTGLSPRPTDGPSLKNTVSGGFPFRGFSSLFGANGLRFDKPLILPKAGHVEWDVSSLQGLRFVPVGGNEGTITQPTDLSTADIPCVLSYLEKGGLFAGNSRSRNMLLRQSQGGVVPTPGEQGYPYALPPGFAVPPGGAALPFWDPQSRFDTQLFRAATATRAGSTEIYGMTAAIDQFNFDADTVLSGPFPNAVMAPVSTRLGTRVRLVGGPASDWWWAPGAPMALVMDTQTPASVYWLDEPITLMPGDALDVTVQVRAPGFLEAALQQQPIAFAEQNQFGISFNGFTAITG
jgi:hypothetical protein